MIATSTSVASRADALAIPPPAVVAAGEPGSAVAQAPKPNPTSQLNLTLGITVLTFHDASGQVIATTPTQQQLNTYLLFGAAQHPAARTPAAVQGGVSGVALVA